MPADFRGNRPVESTDPAAGGLYTEAANRRANTTTRACVTRSAFLHRGDGEDPADIPFSLSDPIRSPHQGSPPSQRIPAQARVQLRIANSLIELLADFERRAVAVSSHKPDDEDVVSTIELQGATPRTSEGAEHFIDVLAADIAHVPTIIPGSLVQSLTVFRRGSPVLNLNSHVPLT
jgi:hypothetical protein